MSEHARTPAKTEAATLPAAAPAARPQPAAARILELQRRAGNAAVNRLLRTPAPPRPTTMRERFAVQMHNRFGVADVRAGTEQDQLDAMRRATPSGQASPTAIAGWSAWQPGSEDLYHDILDAFEAMTSVLGGIPAVEHLHFHATSYENVGGSAQARTTERASYGDGRLNVYATYETIRWPLPNGRTTASAAAPVSFGSTSDSRRRVMVHELCHGVYERSGSPLLGGDTQFFRDWEAAAGWVGGRCVQNGTTLTRANWNEDWPEQPVSGYAVAGNAMEDFCESLMCLIEMPDVLRARSPARFAFLQSRVPGWGSALRRPSVITRPLLRPAPAGDYVVPSGEEQYA